MVEMWKYLDKAYYVVCPKNLFSDCRVAVVLGTFNGQITSCPATMKLLNDSLPVMPFCGSIKANWTFRQEVFSLSVRMFLLHLFNTLLTIFSMCTRWIRELIS